MDRNITAFLEHLAGERGLSENTIGAYRNDLSGLTTFIEEAGHSDPEDVDWDQFDEVKVAEFVQHLDERGYANATRSRKIASLRSFMRFLREEGVTSDLPTRRLKAPRGGKPLPKALTIDEVAGLLDEVTKASTPAELRDRAVVELLYAGGLRVSEVTSLDVSHVNFDNFTIRVFGKGSKERIVPIYDAAMEALADYYALGRPKLGRYQDPDAMFLNARGTRITRQGLWLATKADRIRCRHHPQDHAPHASAQLCLAFAQRRRVVTPRPRASRPRKHRHHPDLHAPNFRTRQTRV